MRTTAVLTVDRPLGRMVRADGPKKNVEVLFIGEAPGVAEEQMGRPFVGKTGKEMYRLCKQAGINFAQCRRTNVVLYRPFSRTATGNNPPSREEIKRDEPQLIEEIRTIQPRFIAAVGRVAAVWLLGPVDIEDTEGFAFPLPERTIKKICGDEIALRRVVEEVRVVVLRHPAAGFHSPEAQPIIYWDFMQLGKYVTGKLVPEPPRDEYPDPDYYEPRTSVSLSRTRRIAIDTEGLKGRVWGLSFTQTSGSAGVIRVTNRKVLASFKEQLLRQ